MPQQDLRVANELSAFFIASPKKVDRRPVRDAPADGEAHRAAHGVRARSCRPARSPRRKLRVVGFLDAILGGKKKLKGAGGRPAVRDVDGVRHARRRATRSRRRASPAIVFQPLATADFESIVAEMEELLASTGADTGTTISTSTDEHGYRWMILHDDDVEDLVVGINAVKDALDVDGYGDRVLAAVFAFKDSKGRPVYFIYNYKRGYWYPFVPAGHERARHRARAADPRDHRRRAADRARARALVPALGHPDLGLSRAASPAACAREAAHLRAVAADAHVAPRRRAVARLVVERPLAGRRRADLQPLPSCRPIAPCVTIADARARAAARARRRRRRSGSSAVASSG